MFSTDLITAARTSKAWPFQEAQRLAKRFRDGKRDADGNLLPVLFETGYGPSGLPHIGTFQEVLRTTLVRKAYEIVAASEDGTPAPTRLIAFSDDMDGLRKVPDNVPNKDMLTKHLGMPLSRIPDPFGSNDSFAGNNNRMLREFLDRYGFDYEFVAASDRYNSGGFDEALRQVLRKFGDIMDIMLPTLREERRQTYSPVLPVSPTTGVVLQVPVEVVDAESGVIRFTDEDGKIVEQSALGGRSKLQWKVDWAMRWYALGVDYEMCGKDLTDSVTQSGRIVKALGGSKPEGMIVEMFLDAKGEKISKSKGNGLSMEEWLTYGSQESMSHYIYANPKSAKQLHVGIIPKAVDEYWQFRGAIADQPIDKQLGNPAWHLLRVEFGGDQQPPKGSGDSLPVTYGLLLNLAGVLGSEATVENLAEYVANYTGEAVSNPYLDRLIECAINYNRDFVAPTLSKRAPAENEAAALRMLDAKLAEVDPAMSAQDLQTIVYDIGKDESFAFENLRDWFKALYETLLGSAQGPRMGSFIALYGVENTRTLIAEALAKA